MTLRRFALFLTTSLLALSAAVAWAETPEHVTYADTVRVTASKVRSRLADLATTVNIVTPAQLRLGTATRAQDAMAVVPGAHVLDLSGSGTGGAVEARGFAGQGTTSGMLVLVDEIPLNDFESGRVDWNLFAPAMVRRVEFLRGPSSFLYGSATMAGLVNIVTHERGEGSAQWLQTSGGSFGAGDAAGGASWSGQRAHGSLSASYGRLDGYRHNSGAKLSSGYASGRVQLNERWDARARVLAHSGAQGVPGSLPAPDWEATPTATQTPDDHRDDHTYEGAIEMTGRVHPELELVVLGGGEVRSLDATETVLGSALDRTSRTKSGYGELRAHWQPQRWEGADLLVGITGRGGDLESRYLDPAQSGARVGAADVHRTTGGAFALARAPLAQGFSLAAGTRIDWLRSNVSDPAGVAPASGEDDLRAISPTAALNWNVPGHAHAWLSYAGAFKAPELEQLYDARPYDLGFGPLLISNNRLQPQKDDHWEAGARTRVAGSWLEAATYWARVRDEIGFDYGTFREENIARSRHFGIETQWTLAPVQGWSGSLSYAYTKATFDGGDNDGKQINGVPMHQLFARASYEHAAHGSVTLEVESTSRQWVNEDNTTPLPDYALVHAGVRQQLGALELFGSVRNLADKHYATLGYVVFDPVYFPAAGRSFTAGLRASFGQ